MSRKICWISAEKRPYLGKKIWRQGGMGIQMEKGGKDKRDASDNIEGLAWLCEELNV